MPTVAGTVPSYTATVWYGLLVPRGTPPAVIETLNREIAKALAVAERLAAVGFQPEPTTPQAFAKYIETEAGKWARVVKEANIQTD